MKTMKFVKLISIVVLTITTTSGFAQDKTSNYLSKKWEDVATDITSNWYGSDEAQLVAENVELTITSFPNQIGHINNCSKN